ncbi:MAG: type II toxin-antitoxin system CcdA family antitoxin [Desulfurococcales archaeon]|nr:type II toxin-antitoxin system CcdA family antitoxin [Desulfurococcales archaeon]MEB3798769.1 type II toxin-antitoxin system CcdA family antitoxin [Desulfurococcales archaeon]MEB3845577.1 type II toxin-antitoxin system CcdA family antitoxin [Desulfurococcales archaeon]
MSTVISVRIPKHLKEEAESLGINIKETVKKALEEAVEEEKARRLAEALVQLAEGMNGLSEEDWISAIRKERDSRGMG